MFCEFSDSWSSPYSLVPHLLLDFLRAFGRGVGLCVCAHKRSQGLKKMEGLCLPGLKELYLHQNKISKIEGLDG